MARTWPAFLLLVLALLGAQERQLPARSGGERWQEAAFEGPLVQRTATPVGVGQCPICGYSATQSALSTQLAAQSATPQPAPAEAAGLNNASIARAVMFWLDGCPHCHAVLDHVLPPLQSQYRDQLEILLIELVTTEDIERLYQTAAAFGIAKENVFVPFLVIGERVLIGGDQIPAELPGLIEAHLAQGGVDFPRLEALSAVLPAPAAGAQEMCAPATPCAETVVEPSTGRSDDPVQAGGIALPRSNGFTLAMAVMAGMAAALVYTGFSLGRGLRKGATSPAPARLERWREAAMVALCLAGLGVAGYLAYVETQMVPAVCGPVGDCNAVQSSPYARLFGVLPVGVLGFLGYLAILAAWGVTRLRSGSLARLASLAIFGMAAFGVLFSLYLTYLEPFVIKAVCIWCLTSAVIMTLLLLLSLPLARQALKGMTHA